MKLGSYSLTRRVLVWGLSIGIILSTLSAITLFVVTYDEARDNQDDQLEEVVGLLARVDVSSRHPDALWMDDEQFEDWFIVDEESAQSTAKAGSTILVRTLHGGGRAMRVVFDQDLHDGAQTLTISGKDYRLVLKTLSRGTHIAVAQRSDEIRDMATASAIAAVIPLLVLTTILFITLGTIFWISTRPVAEFARSLYQRDPNDMKPIASDGLPSELLPLINAFNSVLVKINELREQESRFTADAAHELRSPLAALSLQAERLERSIKDNALRDQVHELRSSIDRTAHLVSQLLSFKRAQAKSKLSDFERVCTAEELISTLSEAIENVITEADQKHIDIATEGLDCLTNQTNLQIPVNRDDLYTILRNLLENAIRYSPQNARVTIQLENLTPFTLSVADTGIGIAPENRQRVFDPFYRVLGTNTTGTGLGLAIVKTLAEQNSLLVELKETNPNNANHKGLTVKLTKM